MNLRLPAEWEIQDGVLVAFPHRYTDWESNLDEVINTYCQLISAIARFEKVLVVAPNVDFVAEELNKRAVVLTNITISAVDTNDTWCRDFGPITVIFNDKPVLLDFGFNGWGLKFPAFYDNLVSRKLSEQRVLKPKLNSVGLILEGGSIETDGLGTILTTAECLLSPNRNPQLSKEEIEQALASLLGANRVLWLNNGYIVGDDTDGHVDTLARICPDNTIVYQGCDNPVDEHFEPLKKMENELKSFVAFDGSPYKLLKLPLPKAVFDDHAHRLPATYSNFLVINNAVIVPTYNDFENDALAAEIIGQAFPYREIIKIDSTPLIKQHGSIHCITMQLPQGVL